jgi:hypothetical protein
VPWHIRVENPKRDTQDSTGRASWYPYYAGYSNKFAYSVLQSAHLDEGSCILDPWNGGGTTTEAALSLGLSARGYDLNPVMVVIAKARTLSCRIKNSLFPISADIAAKSTNARSETILQLSLGNDPLNMWFRPEAVRYIRKFESYTKILLVDETNPPDLRDTRTVNRLSDLAAFFYTVLFRSVRVFLRPFLSSNPTWVKRPKAESDKVQVEMLEFQRVFQQEASYMISTILDKGSCDSTFAEANISIAVASSYSLPDPDNSLSFVLSSPPYCTRIDYAVATMPELALLGYSLGEDFHQLRRKLIGTSTVPPSVGQTSSGWGKTCNEFLEAVKSHDSRASNTYYYKNHFQYFDTIFQSLTEIQRVLVPKGCCILVVQDSYYKDIHNDLQQIFIEMGDALGLSVNKRIDFKFDRSLARINASSRRYRSNSDAVESVLCFENTK